jgi:hypothetical protein
MVSRLRRLKKSDRTSGRGQEPLATKVSATLQAGGFRPSTRRATLLSFGEEPAYPSAAACDGGGETAQRFRLPTAVALATGGWWSRGIPFRVPYSKPSCPSQGAGGPQYETTRFRRSQPLPTRCIPLLVGLYRLGGWGEDSVRTSVLCKVAAWRRRPASRNSRLHHHLCWVGGTWDRLALQAVGWPVSSGECVGERVVVRGDAEASHPHALQALPFRRCSSEEHHSGGG